VSQPSFDELFQKYINQTCTPAEVDQLFDLLETGEQERAAKELLEKHFQDEGEPAGYTDETMRQRLQNRFQLIEQHIAEQQAPPKRVGFAWRWMAAAAVIILLAGSGTWYWLTSETKPAVVSNKPSNEVVPGSDKAVLTLADGKTISLDSTRNGALTKQGSTDIIKTANGLSYSLPTSREGRGEALYNTLTTPRGGQYQLTLPEGSKVWLNAASSIRFPAAFNDSVRVVYVTGEAYFEIKPQFVKNGNERKPFIVQVQTANGTAQEVKVLGTHFNINSYEDEFYVATTLLEGKVSINRPGKASPAFLLPGQQALLNPQTKQVQVVNNADVKQVMAWKNGLFRFDGVELKTVMRQLARWYDVEITFEKGAPVSEPFNGVMQRSLQLSQVLKGMQAMGIHVKKEGRHLIVMP
jgi:transmembrane sensor